MTVFHQLRCDTCEHDTTNKCPLFNQYNQRWIRGENWAVNITALCGCASHSSIHIDDNECIWMTSEEEERRIRKDERKNVLDTVEPIVAKLVPLSYYYEVSVKLKELRQDNEQEGSV